MFKLILPLFWTLSVFSTVWLARRKGKEPLRWLVTALFTGLLGFIAVFFSEDQEADEATRKKTRHIGHFLLLVLFVLSFPIWQLLYRNFQNTITQKQQMDRRAKNVLEQLSITPSQ